MTTENRVDVLDGKYTVCLSNDLRRFRALRHGEEWRDLCGDNLVFGLATELQEARERIAYLEGLLCRFREYVLNGTTQWHADYASHHQHLWVEIAEALPQACASAGPCPLHASKAPENQEAAQ